MRKVTIDGNENVLEVLYKIEPFILQSKSETLLEGIGLLKRAYEASPTFLLERHELWEMMLAYYQLCTKIAHDENSNVSKVDWFISLTAIIAQQSEEEIRVIVEIAYDIRSEL